MMKVERFAIPGVVLVTPDIFRDERGFFLETFQRDRYEEVFPGGVFCGGSITSGPGHRESWCSACGARFWTWWRIYGGGRPRTARGRHSC